MLEGSAWVWWILTAGFMLYFVIMLLEFNKPQQQLLERIDAQEQRRTHMRQRLAQVQEEEADLARRMEEMDISWQELDDRRKEILPDANTRRMTEIPPGSFTMGGREEDSPKNELPSHSVHISSFYIGRFPVTNQDYKEFINCTGYKPPIHWQRGTFPTGLGQHPVVNVSWIDAREFAEWSGGRLLTEAEWEKAAKGDGEFPYPWGERFVEGERCNSNNTIGMTTAVNEFPEGRSPYGVWDMSGNVYEWCADYFDDEYYRSSPASNPRGPDGGQEHVIRGGSFSETRAGLRVTHRGCCAEATTRDTIGFRIGMDGRNDEEVET